jgi:hypothetical protein
VCEGEGAEENAVDDAEDGGVRADTEGQGEDHHDGEARSFAKSSQGIAEVLDQHSHSWGELLHVVSLSGTYSFRLEIARISRGMLSGGGTAGAEADNGSDLLAEPA